MHQTRKKEKKNYFSIEGADGFARRDGQEVRRVIARGGGGVVVCITMDGKGVGAEEKARKTTAPGFVHP